MNVVAEIQRINEEEIKNGYSYESSWHYRYKDSNYIFIGNIDYSLREGDIICVFSQFGEVIDCHLVKDPETKKSKGFCFLAYYDPRSCILAVDNFNGVDLHQRTLRVDHCINYRLRKPEKTDNNIKNPESEYIKRRLKVWDYEAHKIGEKVEEEKRIKNNENIDAITEKMKNRLENAIKEKEKTMRKEEEIQEEEDRQEWIRIQKWKEENFPEPPKTEEELLPPIPVKNKTENFFKQLKKSRKRKKKDNE